jgi:hypothetical protein
MNEKEYLEYYREWYSHLHWPILIDAADERTKDRAAGLMALGKVKPVEGLTLSQANQGAAVVNVLVTEAAQEAEREEVEAQLARERAEEAKAKSKSAPPKPRSAQEIFDELAAGDGPKPKPVKMAAPRSRTPQKPLPPATAEELRNPPESVDRHDIASVGKWSTAIADGRTKVV